MRARKYRAQCTSKGGGYHIDSMGSIVAELDIFAVATERSAIFHVLKMLKKALVG